MEKLEYKIVDVEEIPKEEAISPPLDDLMALYSVIQKMEMICRDSNGIGLSAFQIGLPWKLFVIDRGSYFEYLINADYEPVSQEQVISLEACLSLVKNKHLQHFRVERYKSVRVRAKRLVIESDELKLLDVDFTTSNDIYNIVYQHEIDHQRGVLISDIGEEIEVYR